MVTGLRFLDGGPVYLANVQTLIDEILEIEDAIPTYEFEAFAARNPPLILGRYERHFAPPQSWLDCEWAVRQLIPGATAREVEREARAVWDAYNGAVE